MLFFQVLRDRKPDPTSRSRSVRQAVDHPDGRPNLGPGDHPGLASSPLHAFAERAHWPRKPEHRHLQSVSPGIRYG